MTPSLLFRMAIVALLAAMLACKPKTYKIPKVYMPGDGLGHTRLSTDYPRAESNYTLGDTLYTTKSTLSIADYAIGNAIYYHLPNFTGEECLRQKMYAEKRPFDTLIAHSVELEIMNFLLSYYQGTDKERIEAAFSTLYPYYCRDVRGYRVQYGDAHYQILLRRYSDAQRDTMELIHKEVLGHIAKYNRPKYRYYKSDKAPLHEYTLLNVWKYYRVFTLGDYCAFQESYGIMQRVQQNIKRDDKIYVVFCPTPANGKRQHTLYEYTDVFTELDFYKDEKGILKMRQTLLNPSNVDRVSS